MIDVQHLPFNFGEKISFVNYCQRALSLFACHVPRTTLAYTFFIFIKKEKIFDNYFRNFDDRVCICFDI